MFKFNFHNDVYTEKKNGLTCFRVSPGDFEKWFFQNKAVYAGDFVEGCLLDNFVVATKRGFAAVYEHFVNEWSSDYYIEFEPGTAQTMFNNWYEFENKALQAMNTRTTETKRFIFA